MGNEKSYISNNNLKLENYDEDLVLKNKDNKVNKNLSYPNFQEIRKVSKEKKLKKNNTLIKSSINTENNLDSAINFTNKILHEIMFTNINLNLNSISPYLFHKNEENTSIFQDILNKEKNKNQKFNKNNIIKSVIKKEIEHIIYKEDQYKSVNIIKKIKKKINKKDENLNNNNNIFSNKIEENISNINIKEQSNLTIEEISKDKNLDIVIETKPLLDKEYENQNIINNNPIKEPSLDNDKKILNKNINSDIKPSLNKNINLNFFQNYFEKISINKNNNKLKNILNKTPNNDLKKSKKNIKNNILEILKNKRSQEPTYKNKSNPKIDVDNLSKTQEPSKINQDIGDSGSFIKKLNEKSKFNKEILFKPNQSKPITNSITLEKKPKKIKSIVKNNKNTYINKYLNKNKVKKNNTSSQQTNNKNHLYNKANTTNFNKKNKTPSHNIDLNSNRNSNKYQNLIKNSSKGSLKGKDIFNSNDNYNFSSISNNNNNKNKKPIKKQISSISKPITRSNLLKKIKQKNIEDNINFIKNALNSSNDEQKFNYNSSIDN